MGAPARCRRPVQGPLGKVNFIDPDFVRRNHGFDAFEPLISPIFMNDYLEQRLGPGLMADPFPGLTDVLATQR